MANYWYDFEDPSQRVTQTLRRVGRTHTFICPGVPVGARLDLVPARGTNLAGIAKLGSMTGITGVGVRVTDVSVRQRGGNPDLVVQAIEPQGYTTDATGPELKGSRREHGEGYMQTGEMLFVSANRTGAGIPVPHATYFTNLDNQVEGGEFGRVCTSVDQDGTTVPGLIFTAAHFQTAGWGGDRQAGVAKVSVKGLDHMQDLLREPAGQRRIIQGPDTDPSFYPSRWRVTKGDVSALSKKCIIVIETAYATLNLPNLLSYIDTTNANYMSRLGLQARTLRMLAPDATRWWKQGALWYADYSMLYDPLAGHNDIESLRETKVACEVPLWDTDGADTGKTRIAYDWRPVKVLLTGARVKTIPETRIAFPERSWSDIDAMIQW